MLKSTILVSGILDCVFIISGKVNLRFRTVTFEAISCGSLSPNPYSEVNMFFCVLISSNVDLSIVILRAWTIMNSQPVLTSIRIFVIILFIIIFEIVNNEQLLSSVQKSKLFKSSIDGNNNFSFPVSISFIFVEKPIFRYLFKIVIIYRVFLELVLCFRHYIF